MNIKIIEEKLKRYSIILTYIIYVLGLISLVGLVVSLWFWLKGFDKMEAWNVLYSFLFTLSTSILIYFKSDLAAVKSYREKRSSKMYKRINKKIRKLVLNSYINPYFNQTLISNVYLNQRFITNPTNRSKVSVEKQFLEIFNKEILFKKLLFLSDSGQGKSMACNKISEWILQNSELIPFIIQMGDWKFGDTVLSYIYKVLNDFYNVNIETATRMLNNEDCVFIFDGLDEVENRKTRKNCLNKLVAFSEDVMINQFVMITCKKSSFEEIKINLGNFEVLQILPLKDIELKKYLESIFNSKKGEKLYRSIIEEGLLEKLLSNIFFLNLTCRSCINSQSFQIFKNTDVAIGNYLKTLMNSGLITIDELSKLAGIANLSIMKYKSLYIIDNIQIEWFESDSLKEKYINKCVGDVSLIIFIPVVLSFFFIGFINYIFYTAILAFTIIFFMYYFTNREVLKIKLVTGLKIDLRKNINKIIFFGLFAMVGSGGYSSFYYRIDYNRVILGFIIGILYSTFIFGIEKERFNEDSYPLLGLYKTTVFGLIGLVIGFLSSLVVTYIFMNNFKIKDFNLKSQTEIILFFTYTIGFSFGIFPIIIQPPK